MDSTYNSSLVLLDTDSVRKWISCYVFYIFHATYDFGTDIRREYEAAGVLEVRDHGRRDHGPPQAIDLYILDLTLSYL